MIIYISSRGYVHVGKALIRILQLLPHQHNGDILEGNIY